mgnify:CR=1 FL=1
MDAKTLIAMRDEMERIQGGVGLSTATKPTNILEEPSAAQEEPAIISNSNLFGPDGASLPAAALIAMNEIAGEENGR